MCSSVCLRLTAQQGGQVKIPDPLGQNCGEEIVSGVKIISFQDKSKLEGVSGVIYLPRDLLCPLQLIYQQEKTPSLKI